MADSVGSVSVDVVPDARGWSEKLRAQLRDVTVNVPVDADTAKAQAKLDKLDASSADVTVGVDSAAAETKLEVIEKQVDHLDGRTANVNVKTDKSSVGGAASALEKFSGSLGALPALAIAAGAALIPLGAAIGGVGLFAVLGGLAVKKTEKQIKDIDKLKEKLGGLDKGTKEYTDTQKQLAAATAALSPAQKKLADAQDTLGGAFAKLLSGKAGDALLAPIAQGMNLLAGVLPRLTPIITAVSGALTDLLGDLGDAMSGPGFGRFISQISQQIGPDIKAFGGIIGDVAKGVGDLLLQFGSSDLSGGLLKQLGQLGSSFSGWASSKKGRDQVQGFIAYVKDVGPDVADAIGKIAHAFVRIGEALAPMAPGVLKGISGIFDAISAIPLPILTTLGTTVLALTAFNKLGGFKVAGLLGKGFGGGKVGGLGGGLLGGGKGVVPVYVTNKGFGDGLPGGGGPGGSKLGLLGKLGLGAVGIPAVGAIAEGTRGILQKSPLGNTLGGAVGAAGFGAIGVPTVDPRIAVAQGHLWDQVFQGHFSKALDMLKAPGPVVDPNAGKLSPSKLSMFRGGGPVAPSILAGPLPFAQAAQSIKATTTAVDGLKGASAQASHQIDLIGPQSVQASNVAVGAFHRAQSALNAIHDKRIQIIVDDQGLISRLQAINNMVIHDKTFTVTQISRVVERNVGPGGGIHQLPTTARAAGGWIRGPGTGTSDSIPTRLSTGEFVVNAAAAAANRDWLNQINNSRRAPGYAMGGPVRAAAMGPVHVTVVGHVDEDGYITGTSQDVYAANHDFERAHG